MANPYFQFDLYAAVIFAGLVQGFFLFWLFLLKPFRQPYHHSLLALLVFSFACITLEIFLCYSGLIVYTPHLVDFSEPVNFLIGPSFYLFLRSLRGQHWVKKDWLHFIPFAVYLAHQFFFLLQPEAVKMNAYLSAYHPEESLIPAISAFPADPLRLRSYLDILTLSHLLAYIVLIAFSIRKWATYLRKDTYLLSWMRALVGFYILAFVLYLLVEVSFKNDLGDHFMATFITVQLFAISYLVITKSTFFQPLQPIKYQKSALKMEAKNDLIQKLQAMEETRFYLQPSASLQGLAKALHTSPHYLSQALNETLNKSFFEYLADRRIQAAKNILADPAHDHLKIEEVAEMTGYLSNSAFNTVFKKQTGSTPGEYRKRFQGASR